jgi:nucleoid-associated protein YgaU
MADNTQDLVKIRGKYDPAIKAAHQLGVRISKSEMQGGKLLIQGEAPSDQAKNKVWDEVKKIDPGFRDLTLDLKVAAGGGAAPGVGGPAGTATAPRTYTVKKGDTLSKIAKELYGNASDYKKIFEANRDKLKDPDKIQPGQVLTIP